jgi:hypothetical protein
VFGAYDTLLSKLGASAQPSLEHYIAGLSELASQADGMPLNPNELRVALQVLSHISTQATAAGRRVGGGMHVPNDAAVLVPATTAYFNDSPWLAAMFCNRSHNVHVVHPTVSWELCNSFGISLLSRAVTRAPAPTFAGTATDDAVCARLTRTTTTLLRSVEFARAIALLVLDQASQSQGSAAQAAMVDVASLAGRVYDVVRALTVVFVDALPITLSVGTASVVDSATYFLDRQAKRLYVCKANTTLGWTLVSLFGESLCHVLEDCLTLRVGDTSALRLRDCLPMCTFVQACVDVLEAGGSIDTSRIEVILHALHVAHAG